MKTFAALLAFAMTLGASGLSGTASAQERPRPSFDCARATAAIERTICSDAHLSWADATMARLYSLVRISDLGRDESSQRQVQREWLARREIACTGLPAGEQRLECQRDFFDERVAELAVAALFREPALALPILRRVDPDGAPMAEAIYRYANGILSDDRPLPRLVEPYMQAFASEERLSYGRAIFEDFGLRTAEDVLESQQSFARFLQVASAYGEGTAGDSTMPCQALWLQPDLIEATGPVFGSTLDVWVLRPNCRAMLPPLPELDRLTDRIQQTWPQCDGTIRFAAQRSFGLAIDKARIGYPLAEGEGLEGGEMPRLEGVSTSLVQQAVRAMARYYLRHAMAGERMADSFARERIGAIMSAGHICF